jgi:hypothetical protein
MPANGTGLHRGGVRGAGAIKWDAFGRYSDHKPSHLAKVSVFGAVCAPKTETLNAASRT